MTKKTYVCDRCGKEIDQLPKYRVQIEVANSGYGFTIHNYDLCDLCFGGLDFYLKAK